MIDDQFNENPQCARISHRYAIQVNNTVFQIKL